MKADPELDTYFYKTGWILIFICLLYVILARVFGLDLLKHLPPCAFYTITGYYCPGCGGSRAVAALLHGKLIRSVFFHPFVLYAAVVGGWFMISQTVQRLSKNRIRIGLHYRNVYLFIALALIFINLIIKNAVLYFSGIALMG